MVQESGKRKKQSSVSQDQQRYQAALESKNATARARRRAQEDAARQAEIAKARQGLAEKAAVEEKMKSTDLAAVARAEAAKKQQGGMQKLQSGVEKAKAAETAKPKAVSPLAEAAAAAKKKKKKQGGY